MIVDSIKKLFYFLYYGGISSNHREQIIKDIEASNRISVIAFSAFALAAFIAMTLFASLNQNAVSKNSAFYILASVIMLIMLLLNIFTARRYPKITHVSAYLFVISILAIGILLAVSSKDDVTASYMVFLFVAPLLFTLRPLYIILIILVSDLFYISYMHQIQVPELFQKNIVNAIIYGVMSIFVSTTMNETRIQKFKTDYTNRILMETDQLTGILNRHSFGQYIAHFQNVGSVAGMKVCAFDVNGLKNVNDNIGHHAGDELLRGAAACIENVFSRYGYCYRIGGDEFIAILPGNSPSEEELIDMLNKQTLSFKGTYVPSLSISTGIAVGTEKDSIADLLRNADAKMYENKAKYYSDRGIDRRKK